MSFLSAIPLIGKVTDNVAGYFGKKQDNKHELDTEIVRNSWKDEAILFAFLALFLAPIFPGGEQLAERVFAAFGYWPPDFRELFVYIVGASFGASLWSKGYRGHKNGKVRQILAEKKVKETK